MEVAPESVGKASTCPKCGNVVTVRPNQPSKADQRGTAAGPGVNPVVFLVVAAVIIAFAAVGLAALTGILPFGPPAENSTTNLQDDTPTNQQKIDANVPSERTEPNQEPGDNEPSLDPRPDSDGSETGANGETSSGS
jgi:hypothetical protein